MTQDLVADSVEQLLAELCTPRRVREIEAGGSGADLWREILLSGFADALVPEASGGPGLGLAGAFPILLACGRHAVPLPLAPTMMVRAVLATAGQRAPEGPATLASCRHMAEGAPVECPRVPFGRVAEWVLVDLGDSSALFPAADAEVGASGGLGRLEADMRWSSRARGQQLAAPLDGLTAGACVCAAQLAGAMERVLAVTIAYANDRTQFGRSIGKFQAIQQQLSVMAEQVSAARMAARLACHGEGYVADRLRVAVAKARTGEAAAAVAAIAHAVHGAMGITEECDLQLYTRRLHEWRFAFGSESYWNEVVGDALLAADRKSAFDFVRELSPFQG